MSEIPESTAARAARLASLPLAAAGRMTLGWGQRLSGRDKDEVTTELQRKTAEQIFEVLGTLKGGAMKFGQALSVFEAAIPEEVAAPYRDALVKLQNAAPPMSTQTVHRMLAEQLGSRWRERFDSFGDDAVAAASVGQVHRGVWHDGREVAVKIQYPSAAAALRTDLTQLGRMAPLLAMLMPGVEIRPLLAELKERMLEELDYRLEADHQRTFAAEYTGDAAVRVPAVVASAPKVIVSEWLDGTGVSTVIRDGTAEQRDRCGALLAEFHFSAPQRTGLLHADPHPGNFMLAEDGHLVVLDFGSCATLPDGSPPLIGRIARLALDDDADGVVAELRAAGFIPERYSPDPQVLIDYLVPFAEPLRTETFRFSRAWMQEQTAKVTDLSSEASKTARHLNLPPDYLLVHRVTLGSLGVLCQLGATVPLREIVTRWQPGFTSG